MMSMAGVGWPAATAGTAEQSERVGTAWQGQRGKAKKFHSSPENEGGFNSKWEEEQGQSGSLQRQHVRLEQRGTEHMAQRVDHAWRSSQSKALPGASWSGLELGALKGATSRAAKKKISIA